MMCLSSASQGPEGQKSQAEIISTGAGALKGAVTGLVIGGPVGMIFGLLAGGYMAAKTVDPDPNIAAGKALVKLATVFSPLR